MNGQLHSCIYRGQVVHRRFRPVPHRFAYRVFWLYLDLDELPAMERSLRLLSIEGHNVVSFRTGDHGPCDGSPLVPWVLAELRRAGIVLARPRIRLLAFPRLLGYAFNPLSVFYCHDGERLAAVIYEVRNTFGGRHCYVLPAEPGSRHGCEKSFHVSPFLGMGGSYRFTLRPPGPRLGLSIRERDEGGLLLLACMSGARMPLCDRAILSCLVLDPLMTWKVMGAIHIEALRLWLKGVQHFTRPAAGGPGMRV